MPPITVQKREPLQLMPSVLAKGTDARAVRTVTVLKCMMFFLEWAYGMEFSECW